MEQTRVGRSAWQIVLVGLLVCWPAARMCADQGDPPDRVARISYLRGTVSLQPAGENQWSQASLNYPMTTNDRLYTDHGARVELDAGSSAVRLSETTDLTVADLTGTFMQLGLAQGTIRVSVYELPPGNSIEVDTPNGALTLMQPGYYRVDTYPNDNATLLSVYSGSVQLSGGGLSQTVSGGQAVKLTGSGPIQVGYVSTPAPDSFDLWCAERDRLFTASAPYVSRDMDGYEDLSANGTWTVSAQYGPVWYPNSVPVGWVPYTYGQWDWVEPWGWTWVSEEPWGFAPFHYGRWAYIGTSWGWVPGPIVVEPYYAPALVAFVGGPGFSVAIGAGGPGVAWFPLGPGEPFFPWYHYGNAYLTEVNVTNTRNVANFLHVRNISAIHYANERIATTAVSRSVFSSGGLVRNNVVRVNPQQMAKAQIVPHPSVNPTARAAMPGGAVRAPVSTPRFAAGGTPAPRPAPPASAANRGFQPPPQQAARNSPPVSQLTTRSAPSVTQRRLITRTPLPARSLSFETRLKAMQSHPGRPLEPQQRANLRAGKPAGPMRDQEFPPHAAPRAASPAPSRGGGRRP
jgi:hypothetical protein